MGLQFLPVELARWDAVSADALVAGTLVADALVVTLFSDERPLRGAAGLADWRLCGRLSRLVRSGRFTGARGESLLLPPARRRLPFERVVMFGLGASDEFEETHYRFEVRRMREVLERAQLRRYFVQLPGRSTGIVAARRALEMWLEAAAQDRYQNDVTVLDSAGGQREMSEVLRQARG